MLFFLGVSALSLVFLSVYQALAFLNANENAVGAAAVLYVASLLLTGIFSLVSFWYHVRKKK